MSSGKMGLAVGGQLARPRHCRCTTLAGGEHQDTGVGILYYRSCPTLGRRGWPSWPREETRLDQAGVL